MNRYLYASLLLLLAALYIYFLGTPLVSRLTGLSLRAVSLTSGFAIVLFGIAAMMLGKLTAQRGPDER